MRNQRVMLAVVAMTMLLGTGCACLYGACGSNSRTVIMKYDDEDCWTLSLAMNSRNVLGDGDRKQHRMGDGELYYVDCLYFPGKKGQTLTVQVRSSDFAPDIYLQEKGKDGALASDNGSSVATMTATLPKNDTYAILVTSVPPLDRGDYTIAYESE
jgi:hypothetical protein